MIKNNHIEIQQDQQTLPFDMISLGSLGSHMLFGEIDEDKSCAAVEFIIKANLLFDSSQDLTLFVNSPGGTVSDGWCIIDAMATSRLDVQTVGIGLVASMGLLITSAGTKGKRILTKNTEIMAHQFHGFIHGKYHDLVATQRFHERLEKQFLDHFKKHSTMTEKQIKDILFSPSDRWLNANEAKKYGLCDIVSDYFVMNKK
jgi:ATP-dependent Clp protease protease subunit